MVSKDVFWNLWMLHCKSNENLQNIVNITDLKKSGLDDPGGTNNIPRSFDVAKFPPPTL